MDGDVPRLESLEPGQLDLLGVEPHHRLVDQPVQGDRADLLRDRRDRLVEVGGDIVGLARAWAIRRARHTGISCASSRSHTEGSRCRSTSASRITDSPALVDTPSAAANGAPASQATAGTWGSGASGSRSGSTSVAVRRRAAVVGVGLEVRVRVRPTIASTSRSVSRALTAAAVSRTSAITSIGVAEAVGVVSRAGP